MEKLADYQFPDVLDSRRYKRIKGLSADFLLSAPPVSVATEAEWREEDHPRGDDGRFIDKADIAAAKQSDTVAYKLFAKTNDPVQRKWLEKLVGKKAPLGTLPDPDAFLGMDLTKKGGLSKVPKRQQELAGGKKDAKEKPYNKQKAIDEAKNRSILAKLKNKQVPAATATGGNGQITVRDASKALASMEFKPIKRDSYGAEVISEMMADEFEYGFNKNPHWFDWYTTRAQDAISAAAIDHPELLDNQDHRNVFVALLALTSDGSDPNTNYSTGALPLYEAWAKNGEIPEDFKYGGSRQPNMVKNVKLLNKLLQEPRVGVKGLQKFLNSQWIAKDFQRYTGLKLSGVSAFDLVKGSNTFGPKLGSYYGNLNGDLQTVTADIWVVRGSDRREGKLGDEKTQLYIKNANELLALLKEGEIDTQKDFYDLGFKGEVNAIKAELRKISKTDGIPAEGGPLDRWIAALERRYATGKDSNGKSYADKTPLHRIANRYYRNLKDTHDAPKNARERWWYNRVFAKAIEKLAERGYQIQPAQLQSVLWHVDKEIYQATGYSIDEGDYLDAAYRKWGEEKVKAFLQGDQK